MHFRKLLSTISYIPYRGAGILFCRKTPSGMQVLLGLRNGTSPKGVWSIPGGGMEPKDNNSYWECALREADEELNRPDLYKPAAENDWFNNAYRSTLKFPFLFTYPTYIVDVTGLSIGTSHNSEFREVGWFSVSSLPENTHWGVRYTLFQHKIRLKRD